MGILLSRRYSHEQDHSPKFHQANKYFSNKKNLVAETSRERKREGNVQCAMLGQFLRKYRYLFQVFRPPRSLSIFIGKRSLA